MKAMPPNLGLRICRLSITSLHLQLSFASFLHHHRALPTAPSLIFAHNFSSVILHQDPPRTCWQPHFKVLVRGGGGVTEGPAEHEVEFKCDLEDLWWPEGKTPPAKLTPNQRNPVLTLNFCRRAKLRTMRLLGVKTSSRVIK